MTCKPLEYNGKPANNRANSLASLLFVQIILIFFHFCSRVVYRSSLDLAKQKVKCPWIFGHPESAVEHFSAAREESFDKRGGDSGKRGENKKEISQSRTRQADKI
jgi:hypothetical protein